MKNLFVVLLIGMLVAILSGCSDERTGIDTQSEAIKSSDLTELLPLRAPLPEIQERITASGRELKVDSSYISGGVLTVIYYRDDFDEQAVLDLVKDLTLGQENCIRFVKVSGPSKDMPLPYTENK